MISGSSVRRHFAHILCVLFLLQGCGNHEQQIPVDLVAAGDDPAIPRLEPPITSEETTAMRTSFSWHDTEPLNETDEDGNPALYYALILIDEWSDETLLEMAGIYFDAMPIFPAELSRWEGQQGMIEFEADEGGAFVYAILAGEMYNHLRQAALDGEPVFDAVILREPPNEEAELPGGSLSYRWLVEQGFTYGFEPEELENPASATTGAVSSPLFGRIIRGIINIGRGIVNGVRRGIGAVKELIGGSRRFRFELNVVNTESAFDRTLTFRGTTQTDNLMRQAWGSQMNRELTVDGAKVMIGVNASLTVKKTDRNGFVSTDIPKGRRLRVFVRLRNDAAVITSVGVWDKRLAVFKGRVDRNDAIFLSEDVRDRDMNVLAQFTDSRRYTRLASGWNPTRAVVSMGPRDDRSWSPCLSYMSYGRWGTTSWRRGSGAWNFILGVGSLFSEFDVAMLQGSSSRGVPAHEYGHYLMCDMLFHIKRRDFGRAWGEVARDTVRQNMGEAGIVAEGWADFFAHQVSGGVDYFRTAPGSGTIRGGVFYCDSDANPARSPCMDDNVGGSMPWPDGQLATTSRLGGPRDEAIARIATLLHDAFDGDPVDETIPGNGGNWTFTASPFDSGPHLSYASHADDEVVRLRGASLYLMLSEWSDRANALHFAPFFDALAQEAIDTGFSRAEVCRMFAIHSPSGDCDDVGPVSSASSPLLLGAPLALDATTELLDPLGDPSATLTWSDISEEATDYYTEVADGDTIVASTDVPYARNQSVTFDGLPFDRNLDFTVVTRNGSEVGAPSVVNAWTPPEPVLEIIEAWQVEFRVTVRWPATDATEYIVEVTDVASGDRWEAARVTGTSAEIYDLPQERAYEFRVISVNGAGQQSAYPSAPVELFVEEVILG